MNRSHYYGPDTQPAAETGSGQGLCLSIASTNIYSLYEKFFSCFIWNFLSPVNNYKSQEHIWDLGKPGRNQTELVRGAPVTPRAAQPQPTVAPPVRIAHTVLRRSLTPPVSKGPGISSSLWILSIVMGKSEKVKKKYEAQGCEEACR